MFVINPGEIQIVTIANTNRVSIKFIDSDIA